MTDALRAVDPAAFRAWWRACYGQAVPRGSAMREAEPARWVRVHSLPDGKRHAESADERATLLARHNAVADAVLADGPCVLLGYDHHGADRLPPSHPLRAWLPDAPPVMRLAPDDAEGEATSIFAGRLAWLPGALDGPLLEVAEDRLRLMLLNWATGAACAPYDGGADLFWPTADARDRAAVRFRAWRSVHPHGL